MAAKQTVYHVAPSGERAAAAGVKWQVEGREGRRVLHEPHRTQKDALDAAHAASQGAHARAGHRPCPGRTHPHRVHLRRPSGLPRRTRPQGRTRGRLLEGASSRSSCGRRRARRGLGVGGGLSLRGRFGPRPRQSPRRGDPPRPPGLGPQHLCPQPPVSRAVCFGPAVAASSGPG